MIRDYKNLIEEILRMKSNIHKSGKFDFDYYSFYKAFLLDTSSTEGNFDALKHIEYNACYEDNQTLYGEPITKTIYGLKIKDKNVLLSELFFKSVECCDEIIDVLLKSNPELTKDEIEAFLRFITVILLDLECEDIPDD